MKCVHITLSFFISYTLIISTFSCCLSDKPYYKWIPPTGKLPGTILTNGKFKILKIMCLLYSAFGEGNGIPLQYSCLENPMDRGAWWAAVQGVARVGHDWATSLSLFTFMHWRRKWQPTPVFLPGESQGRGSLVGRRLWSHTESDTNEAT